MKNPRFLSIEEILHYGELGQVEGLAPYIAKRMSDELTKPIEGLHEVEVENNQLRQALDEIDSIISGVIII